MRNEPLPRDSLTDAAIAEIEQMILSGEARPGEWLPPQPELARRLGVGLSTIREAIKGLTLVGVLEPQPGRGTQVSTEAQNLFQMLALFRTRTEQLNLAWAYEARQVIESELSALAAGRADENDIARMNGALEGMQHALISQDDELYTHADLEFHIALGRAAKNALLDQFSQITWGMLSEFVKQALLIPGFKERSLQLQRKILQAIRAHDQRDAQRQTEALLKYGQEIVRASVSLAQKAQLEVTPPSEVRSDGTALPALRVLLTMTCERVLAESPTGGPKNWEFSARAIRAFGARLLEHGYKPTLFLTPECATRHAELLGYLAGQGAELALLVDPQSLGDHRYQRYLAEYDAATQREMIAWARDEFERALGTRPTSFRAGCFSANDATYGVLAELGFAQCSTSDPGRYVPQFFADWRDCDPDAHYASARDRLRPGNLPLFEVPITTDPARLQSNGFPYELRIESGPFAAWHKPILEKTLARFAAKPPVFPTLCIFTHNQFPHEQDDYEGTMALLAMLDYLGRLPYTIAPVTLQEARAQFEAARAAISIETAR